MKYKHLSLEERERLYCLKAQGFSLRDIAKKLGRNQSSLTRELRRNINYGNEYFGNEYLPCRAQQLADKKALKQRYSAPLKKPLIFLYVRIHLREPFCWSPEQISGRLRLDHPDNHINTETIYRYIYSKGARRCKLWELLTLGRKRRRNKGGRQVHKSSKIPGAISIDRRPKVVAGRKQTGHWETDNVIGKQTDKTALSTTVERVILYTLLDKLQNRSATTKAEVLVGRLSQLPQSLRRTITADNGAENTNHQYITQQTGMLMFFCHAYHSWEKGTNENTNGRLRRYIPKGVSIDTITKKQIKEIEIRLNSTPRKKLGFLTPDEKMNQLLKYR